MKTMVYDPMTLKTLLANTIKESADSSTVQEVLNHYPRIPDLLNATEIELQQINGVGPVKAAHIKSILELAKLLSSPLKEERYCIRSPKDAYELLRGEIAHLLQEHFVVIGLNTKNHVLFTHTVTVGTLNSCLVHPREVFRPLIRQSAASCIVAHNHPSSDPQPSREDIDVTNRLVKSGEIIGIEVLDSLVICQHEFTSLKEKGEM